MRILLVLFLCCLAALQCRALWVGRPMPFGSAMRGKVPFPTERTTNDDEDGEEGDQSPLGMLGGGGPGGNANIVCPSGNRVYVHPISGDLQQCSQQLGFYNQTTCPGGTVCERFPILIPGFQDYCCWGSDTSDSENLSIGTGPDTPVSGPDDFEGGDHHGSGHISSSGVTDPPLPFSTTPNNEEDEDEWILATTTAAAKTRRTRRPKPRSRKTTTTEAPTTTTTMAPRTPAPRRGPRCRNPDDAALIDFGNRLRDCYYQQCPYSYRCEFNQEIRRYICCGKERDVFPPPGLPPLPEPKPLVPRPFRPRGPPFFFSEENTPQNPLLHHSPLLETHDSTGQIDVCPAGAEHKGAVGSVTFCEANNLHFTCPTTHPFCVHSLVYAASVCCSHRQTAVLQA